MRRALVLCLVLATATACSGSKHKDTTAEPGTTGTPTTAATTARGATPGATSPVGSSAAPGATAGMTASPGTTTAPPTGSSPAPSHASAATSTPAGTYTYDASGTQTAFGATQDVTGTSTLDVTKAVDGRQTSTQKNSQGTTEQDVLPRADGTFLSALKISGGFNKEFDFAPPALLLPVPAPVGKTWSWSATSTDGKTTASATNKVVRTETLTIGGEKVATVVLQSHLVISGDVSYTADVTTWVATALRLPVKDHTVGKGSTGLTGPFSFDVTDVLRSVHPT